MRIKRKNGLKMIVIALVLLLCLALAVGITGAYYQAKRQATGTLNMDQGIIIDYNGFDKTAAEEWATWTRGVTLPLFSTTDAQPGEHIAVNAAGIRANAESVDFYARVKLSYKFYNNDTEVTLANASDLITTSANFFGTNWVDGGSTDGYYYYATGTTLNKFNKDTQTFVDLFATGAEFVIEGENFTGATSDGEGGGFVVGDTSINKIEVYLTLETLQGDADAAAEGWKIASPVKFAEATGKMETSVNKTETTEDLNVSVAGAAEVPINEVVFPYDTDTTLKFDSNNVEYVTLTYEDGSSDTFEEVAEKTISVRADSSKGKVTGYTVGTWSSSEYKDFVYSKNTSYEDKDQDILVTKPMESGICLTGYFGDETALTIPSSVRVRERDFKIVIEGYTTLEEFYNLEGKISTIKYPCTFNNTQTLNSMRDLFNILDAIGNMTDEEFLTAYPKMEFEFKTHCVTSSILYSKQSVKEIDYSALSGLSITSVTIPGSVEFIDYGAFSDCSNLETVVLEEGVKTIGETAFYNCSNLKSITLPTSVTKIDDYAFYSCTSLTEMVIPEGVVELVGGSTFYDSTNLAIVIIESPTIAGLSESSSKLINYATTVYVKSGLAVGTYVTNSFEKAASSDKAGYDMYTKKA